MKSLTASLVALAGAAAAADVDLYGQCGGEGYTGATTCVSGAYCAYSNAYYSQCLPGTGSTTTTAAASTTSKSTTTTAKLTSTATATTTTTGAATATATATGADASVSGLLFDIDGAAQYYAGTNAYWVSFLTDDADVDTALDAVADAGLKILRVWGFSDVNADPGEGTVWFQLLSADGSTINTGANGLERLDYVVAGAESRGLKLIINFVNYWSDYGGMDAYIAAFGGSLTTWYTDSASQAQYQAYIAAVVSRYASSDAIFAWELANEPRCSGCDTSVITDWAAATSAYVKSLDADHMVTLGGEGFGLATGDGSYPYQFTEGNNFTQILAVDTLDFATLHLYPDSWGTDYDWGNDWIATHGAACAAAGKPCLLEEYGSTSDHCSVESEWQATALATTGMAGDLFWQLGTTISTGETSDDGYTIYTNTSDWTCLVTDHVEDIG
ncbi:glycoside hydrolase superfamily [Xylariaceae sp. FL0804]|nr:glycoside hydrolase superfamily [Xylariaceae sp. FL0804]